MRTYFFIFHERAITTRNGAIPTLFNLAQLSCAYLVSSGYTLRRTNNERCSSDNVYCCYVVVSSGASSESEAEGAAPRAADVRRRASCRDCCHGTRGRTRTHTYTYI